MSLKEFLDKKEETTELVKVEEGQLIVAQQMQEQIINFELAKKAIDKQQKEMKAKLKEVMKANGITKYESNDKRIMITLGEDTTTETVDKEELWLKYPNIYREVVKESKREGSLRVTIREGKNDK